MTVAQFFGCGLIAFGPPIVMFIVTISRDPIRVIMLVARYVPFCLYLVSTQQSTW